MKYPHACAPGRFFSCEPPRGQVGSGVFFIPQMKEPPASAPGRQRFGSRYRSTAPIAISLADRVWRCQVLSDTVLDMNAARRTLFVAVNLTSAARDELRRVTLEMTTPVGRRLSMSDALIGAIRVAMRHRNELIAEIMSEKQS